MVNPTDFRAARPPSRRALLMRRDVWGMVAVIAVVWGLSQAWSAWKASSLAAQIRGKAHGDDVLMVSTSTCPYCSAARRWMDAHDVAYRDCNVEVDADCAALYASRGSPGVPLMRVKGQWQLGFSPQWLAAVLTEEANASKTQP